MTFWRRRQAKWPPGGAGSRRAGEGRFREVAGDEFTQAERWDDGEPDRETEEEAGWDPEWRPDGEFEWEPEGEPEEEFDDEPEGEPGWQRAAASADRPDAGRGEPHVVSTLLSRKPGKDAARAVGWTLGILVAVSALYWWGPPGLAEALPASGEAVFGRGEVWRLVTALAAHADAIHLLSNSVFLTWLIYLSRGAFGASLYPLSAVPLSAVALAVTLEGYAPNIRLVGASGMLYLLAGAWLTLYVLVERRLSVPKRLVRVVGFFLVVLVPTSVRPEVSYRAHAIGLFFGVCLGLAYFLARRDTIRQGERWERDDG